MGSKFFDEARVFISSGRGGNGCCSFRRAKYIPRGGPDGGNGGKGGDVYLKVNSNINSLNYFHEHNKHKAEDGKSGSGQNRNGASGEDIIISVPLGTQVFDENENLICDLSIKDMIVKFLEGGKGGIGNTFFKTSVDRAPRKTTPGTPAQSGFFEMKLKSVANIGLVGLPNAGKSSLINSLTRANSAVDSYAFTTVKPVLGYINELKLTICDIPGLIENAHLGRGKGIKFLKHIERCYFLFFVLDISSKDGPRKDYDILQKEIELYSHDILSKKSLIILNKIDCLEQKEVQKIKNKLKKSLKCDIICISCLEQTGIDDLMEYLTKYRSEIIN